MSKKKVIGLLVIFVLIIVIIFSVFTNKRKDLDTENVAFTFIDPETGQTMTLGWRAYVDRFYVTPGSKASEKVAIKIEKMKANESWVASIERTAANWGLTPAKFLVRDAIIGAVESNMIIPVSGISVPALKQSFSNTSKYGPYKETKAYQFT